MFPSEGHLGTVCQADPIRHAISILSNAPESAVFDLDNFEIDGFAAAGAVPDSNSDDTARIEVSGHLAGEDLAGPVGGFIHQDGLQLAVVAGLGRGHCNTATVVIALDMTIVATSIPTISSELNSASGYLWIGAAYLLATAAGGPVWAKLSDIWGRKPVYLAATVTFGASSIICALSNSIGMLITGRALQGTAGGGLLQLVNIVISDIFSMR
ncbi:MAG: hypothetical protein Q9214_003006 [Letrouitia sp. 1 TL-2023]